MIIQNFDLNLIPDSAPVVVHCDQYDRGTGRLVISLYEGSIAYSPSGTAVIQGVKPDGKGFDYNCTLSGNTVTADLTEQMTAVAGQVRTQIVVTESTGRTGTFVFILDVQSSALPADTDMSESDYQFIEQAIEAAQDAVEDSEAWAVGERGGVPVPSGDETYHNNAKYWAEQAAQYAQGGIIFKGSVAFASIPTTGMNDGDMYNITNDFTTDSRFIEGAGKECAAGTNIVWISDVQKWDILAMSKIGSLDDLNNVEITSPSSGEVLKYDGSKWVNGAGGSASGDYVGLYGDTLVGSDLNNITTIGNYYNDGTITVSNYPAFPGVSATSVFRMTVEKESDSSSTVIRQTYMTIVVGVNINIFTRARMSGYWTTWQKVLTNSTAYLDNLVDVALTSPQDNQVLTFDFAAQRWKNKNAQGGGGSTILVTTSESSLYGQTITLSDGTTTLSGTFSNTGECEFTGVMMTGNLTLACSGVSQSISVPYFGNYSFVFSLFSATVNVTYPYSEGASCTLSDGTTTLIATGSPMVFTVPNAGTWTASVTLDGVSKTDTATITTDGQVASINIIFGTINVTYDNDFRGVSITCILGGTTITKTAPSAGNTMYFYPPTTGNWTISGTVSSDTFYSTPNPVVVSSLSTSVSATLETIPNGSTKTPTDDVSIWLSCAGIRDKSYTTLTEVLADSETFNALLGDSNACAYMARSTTFASTLCADQYAMSMIGQYDVCCDALLGNATWASAIVASAYADYVLTYEHGLVPVMTSNTTPSGEASASTYYTTGYEAYKAFDGVDTNGWLPATADTANNARVIYNFTSAQKIKGARIVQNGTSGSSYNYGVTIQGSNDNNTWVDISSETVIATVNTPYYVICDDSISYPYVCMTITTSYSAGINAGNGWNVQFYCKSSGEYIHGTYNESAYYLDGATQTPIVDPSTLSAGTYTFGSTVAKDPSDLTADYTKTIRITPNTKEIVLRPDKTLYWWGYESSGLEVLSSANGWTTNPASIESNVTFSDYYVQVSGNSNNGGIGSKFAISGDAYVIVQGVTLATDYGAFMKSSTKNLPQSYIDSVRITANTQQKYTLSNNSGVHVCTLCGSGQSHKVSAFWYE